MKRYIVIGIVIGLVLALGIGFGASVVLAQGPNPGAPSLGQMQQMHESMHGAGSWDRMVQQMEQTFGKDWFGQMHGPNGVMNGAGMMNGQHPMGNGGMMQQFRGSGN
jgi:hypothetical protein